MASSRRGPPQVPMSHPLRSAGGPITPALPGLGAAKASASGDPAKMHSAPMPGAAKAAPVKAPERAPEGKYPDRAPIRTAEGPPVTATKQQPAPAAKQQAAMPMGTKPAAQPAPAPAPGKATAPTVSGNPRAMPPPLPTARAPFPAAAIALGVADPDRGPAPNREATPTAPVAKAPVAVTQAAAPAAAAQRIEPHFESDRPLSDPGKAQGDSPDSEAPGGLVDPRAQDIAIMQSLIKGLADQLNAPTAPPLIRSAATHELPAPPPVPTSRAASADDFDDTPTAVPPHALDTVDGQVGALRNVASALRAPDGVPAELHDDPAHDHGYDRGLLGQIAGAVQAARIDVYLDPILGLDDRKARHFEVSVRLRNDDGELLDPRDFAQAMRGTGLGPRIEAHTFTESIQLAGQFAARGAEAALFADLSAESLRDGGFHDALAGALTPDVALASRLIMSVAQSEIRAFGPAHWDALAAMAQTGLRYALVDVVDLDVDFEAIKRRGFNFVRLDAQVFLDGLPAPHGDVPASDLCRYLSGLGFALIVGRIADERELVKVHGFGAVLGQGRLFGAPRPVKVEHLGKQPTAA
jgi:cyclic-di-GMP phosphodiesterase, flagellum assembly factor TipF